MITRRAFTTTALAACCRPLAAAGKLNLGIGTYTYHSLSIDDMIVQLTRLQIREILLHRVEHALLAADPALIAEDSSEWLAWPPLSQRY